MWQSDGCCSGGIGLRAGHGTSPDQGDWAQFTPLLLCVDLSVFPVFQICHMDGNKKLMRTDKCIFQLRCIRGLTVLSDFGGDLGYRLGLGDRIPFSRNEGPPRENTLKEDIPGSSICQERATLGQSQPNDS